MSNQMTQPTTSELLAAMALATNGTGTDLWDIVCSYTEDKINELLKKNHADGLLVTDVKFIHMAKNEYVGNIKYEIELTLGAPQIQFLDDACQLTMQISKGNYTSTPDDKAYPTRHEDFPAGYSLVASAPLGCITGDGAVAKSGTVVEFGSPNETATIVLHFKDKAEGGEGGKGKSVTFMLQPEPKEDVATLVGPLLEAYFLNTVDEIDYALTAVNNNSPPSTSAVAIIPTSFVFASTAGVLSLYIQTANSGNGQGNLSAVFQPGGRQMVPIPQGYTASLIFSKDLIKKVYLTPGLASTGAVTYDDTIPSGIALFLACKKTFEYDPSFNIGDLELISDVVEFDFIKTPYHINIQGDNASLTWTFSQRIKWLLTAYQTDLDTGERKVQMTDDGKATVSVELNKNKTERTEVSDTSLDISFDIQDSDYDLKITGKGRFMSYESTFKKALKDNLRKAKLPSFKIDPGSLQYFAVTNLLFPGKQVLKIDPKAGIQIPLDLILLGDVEVIV